MRHGCGSHVCKDSSRTVCQKFGPVYAVTQTNWFMSKNSWSTNLILADVGKLLRISSSHICWRHICGKTDIGRIEQRHGMVDDGSEVCCYGASSSGHHDNTLLNVASPGSGPSYYTRHTADMLTGVSAVTNSVPKARNTRHAYFVYCCPFLTVWSGCQATVWGPKVQRDLSLPRYLAITIKFQGGKYPHKNWSKGTVNNNSNNNNVTK